MSDVKIEHHFTGEMSEAAKSAIEIEANRLNLKKVYAYNSDNPAGDGTFEIYKEVDTYIFSVDQNGTIL